MREIMPRTEIYGFWIAGAATPGGAHAPTHTGAHTAAHTAAPEPELPTALDAASF